MKSKVLRIVQVLPGQVLLVTERANSHACQAYAEPAITVLPSVIGEADPEAVVRAELSALAQTLPIEKVRELSRVAK